MWRQLGKTGEVKCGWASHLPFHLSSFYTTHTATYTSFSSSSSSTNRRPPSTSPSFAFPPPTGVPHPFHSPFPLPPPAGVPHPFHSPFPLPPPAGVPRTFSSSFSSSSTKAFSNLVILFP